LMGAYLNIALFYHAQIGHFIQPLQLVGLNYFINVQTF
jgi:hypothetical protein